ncbi:MAG: branched-chain amino acid ABC transporter permease [Desulfobacterales bacterium]|nr:branched-chain amino acid ABC transporter permease [Pseudomonadota bacterium]MBU4356189.1 branched-chain amino acid ABC transporter permease [Pseudomonadota bacterium]MCG2772442.1 branched-chain amino acid ABC transporter permease [Desulfobacterales bacterium]
MKAWQKPGFWLPLVIVLVWGGVVLLIHQDTMRETAFVLLMAVGLASSLNILLGYTGYVSFGHIVFFGLGGYTGFYLLSEQGWPLFAAAIGGGLLSAFIAGLVGLAVLRLRGAYFALATIGINEAARAFVSNFGPYGGATGMFVNFSAYEKYGGPGPALWTTFTFLWITTLVVLLVSYLVKHSRFGLGLLAIREDEDAAMVMGVKAPKSKTITYVISAFFPGVIGTLYFFKNGNIEPGDAFQLHMSIEMLVMVMLGGMGTVMGPLVGAVGYQWLRGYLLTSPIFKDLHLAVAGAMLLVIILFVPAGIVGWVRNHVRRLQKVLE